MLRLCIALPPALLTVVGLFSAMAWMVDNPQPVMADESAKLAFNMVMLEEEAQVKRRQRAVPKQPKTPEPPPQVEPMVSQTPLATANVPVVPDLNLDVAISGIAVTTPQFDTLEVQELANNQQVMPLYRVQPSFPDKALRRGIEGYVTVSFTIDPQGRPTDIQITDANPRRMFDREAIKALRRWKYQPKIVNGQAVSQVGQSIKLEFKLNQS